MPPQSHPTLRRHFKLSSAVSLLLIAAQACTWFAPRPIATPTPGATASPAPTATPLPPLAPRVIEALPLPGDELALEGPFTIYFDQPMNRASVEQAFSLAPAINGTFTWPDDATVQFSPAALLPRGADFQVTVGEAARSRAGLALPGAFTFETQTVGFLEVAQVIPAPEAIDVDVQAAITVMFNRPVVPLALLADQSDFPQPLTFEPAVPGTGEWLNTSIYIFHPEGPLAGGTTYSAAVAAGLTDQTGGEMPEAYTWSFTTLTPAVVSIEPAYNTVDVSLTQPITITFNQPMDRASTEAAFTILAPGSVRPDGRLEWNGDSTVLTFLPEQFPLETRYEVKVRPSALAAGGMPLADEAVSFFNTVRFPAIEYTSPADGDLSASPYGGFTIGFTAPMDQSTLESQITILPEPTQVFTYYNDFDHSFSISWDLEPSTDYLVTLGPDMRDPYGNAVGESREVRFTTRALDPLAFLNAPGSGVGTYNASDEAAVFVTTLNLDNVSFTLRALDLDQFMRATGPESFEFNPAGISPQRAWEVPIQSQLNEPILTKVNLTEQEGGRLALGYYLLTMTAPIPEGQSEQRHVMLVSSANLTLKTGLREALVWATDLASGQPLAEQPITLYDARRNQIAPGQTDAEGVFRAEILRLDDLWTTVFAVLGDPASPNFAAASNQWSEGINPWDFNLNSTYYVQDLQAYLYTDRPIYRPGQVVYFKGVVRREDDARYSLPDLPGVPVEIFNDQGERIFTDTLRLSGYGTFTSQLTLSEAAGAGYYFIQTPYGGIGFQVAEYRRPEFQVSVASAETQVAQGETIAVDVNASFFFGGPVSDAAVEYSVLSADYTFQYGGPAYYEFADYDFTAGPPPVTFGAFGELIATGETQTNSAGKATLRIAADLGDKTTSQTLTIEATVTDINGQQVSGRTSVIVHQGEFYLGVRPESYVSPVGQAAPVELIAVGWDQSPLAGQRVNVQFFEHEWFSVQEQDEFGNTIFTWNVRDTLLSEAGVFTDEEGKASASFTPEAGGNYKILVTSSDSGGRTVRAAAYLWVTSGDYVNWRVENNDRINLVADRKAYAPGETAEILIPSPFQGAATALITVERGRILQHEVLTLKNNSTTYRLPITEDHAPYVFVSVVLVKGVDENNPLPGFRFGLVGLEVSNAAQQISVTLTPDKTTVGPRDTVTYQVKATGHKGGPVQGEFSLSLVDLAVLSLAEPNAPPILTFFYGPRGLGVRTGLGLVVNVNRYTVAVGEAKGGGGGGGEAAFFDIRSEFLDTAYWRADVVTDANGEATVEIRLPDNLTTWRLDARGVTADTLVGQSTVDIVATRDLLIRPNTPRFFVVGDRATIGAVVNNNTDADLEAEVSLEATGLEIDSPASQTVTIPARGRALVNWEVTVQDVEEVDATFRVAGGGLQDASKPPLGTPPDQTLPVYKYTVPETVGTAGQLETAGLVVEAVSLPRRFDVTQGELDIRLDPSLAAGLTEGLSYLELADSESTEATVSRFLPNLLTYRALEDLGIADPALRDTLGVLVTEALQKLYSQQHVDGGWGWYASNEASPYLTAYALLGLSKAREAGFAVSEDVISRAADYLNIQLRAPAELSETWEVNRQAFILYVLAEAGRGDPGRTSTLYEVRQRLDHFAEAYLALTLFILDPADGRIAAILSDLQDSAVLSATGAYWEEENRDWWNMNTDLRATAVVLDALVRLNPVNAIIPNVVRWLMSSREATGGWRTTQETAWTLIALTDWMVESAELNADYDYSLALNGERLASGHTGADTLREAVELKVEVAALLSDQANRLQIERGEGEGRLYYTAHLRVFQDVEEVRAQSRGIILGRRYWLPSPNCGGEKQPECPSVTEATAGQDVQVTLTIVVPNDLYYAVIEDPIPAGMEAVDTSLLTTSVVGQPPELNYKDPLYYGWGWWWFSDTDIRDEMLVLSAAFLPKGTYEYTYTLHASLPGTYKVLPPTGHLEYFPEVQGWGDGSVFTILPSE